MERPVRTRANGAVIGVADVDAVQEIQIMTADYGAEYGRAAGGQIRVVSKSGTKDFHGSAYEYLRNSDLNANTWTRNLSSSTTNAAPFRYNNFGWTIGGPAWFPKLGDKWREKDFVFVADWIRYRLVDTQTRAAEHSMRLGNFAGCWFQPSINRHHYLSGRQLRGGSARSVSRQLSSAEPTEP
jgi:hypothetical protein